MKPITAEWVDKAEGDFATTEREARRAKVRTMMASASTRSSAPRSI